MSNDVEIGYLKEGLDRIEKKLDGFIEDSGRHNTQIAVIEHRMNADTKWKYIIGTAALTGLFGHLFRLISGK